MFRQTHIEFSVKFSFNTHISAVMFKIDEVIIDMKLKEKLDSFQIIGSKYYFHYVGHEIMFPIPCFATLGTFCAR